MSLEDDYKERYEKVLVPLAAAVEQQLREYAAGEPRIDRIQARAKSIERFVGKALKANGDTPKYAEPIHQIQDQVGARIVTFYLSDVVRISAIIERYYRPVEAKDLVPESESEFGYFGRHYVLLVPSDLVDQNWDRALVPEFFELQIKTLFQHAWSEADHDLGYKPGGAELPPDAKRKIAFSSAQAWGADQIFDELFSASQKQVGGQHR